MGYPQTERKSLLLALKGIDAAWAHLSFAITSLRAPQAQAEAKRLAQARATCLEVHRKLMAVYHSIEMPQKATNKYKSGGKF